MKVFIFGQNGMLGRYVYSFFRAKDYEVVAINRNELDIVKSDYYHIKLLLSKAGLSKEDVIINCAGLIKQRFDSRFDFIKVNAVFPHLLQKMSEEVDCNFIHVTTDCVFDGLKGSYSELDSHDADDMYGITKSLGEPENATVIRTSIIGEEFKNFFSLLEWVKANRDKEVRGFTNHVWNGITCLQFAKLCKYIMKNNLYWRGVKHAASPNVINKYDLVSLISDIYDLNVKVTPFETDIKCDRSLVSVRDDIIFEIPALGKQLVEMRDFREKLEV